MPTRISETSLAMQANRATGTIRSLEQTQALTSAAQALFEDLFGTMLVSPTGSSYTRVEGHANILKREAAERHRTADNLPASRVAGIALRGAAYDATALQLFSYKLGDCSWAGRDFVAMEAATNLVPSLRSVPSLRGLVNNNAEKQIAALLNRELRPVMQGDRPSPLDMAAFVKSVAGVGNVVLGNLARTYYLQPITCHATTFEL